MIASFIPHSSKSASVVEGRRNVVLIGGWEIPVRWHAGGALSHSPAMAQVARRARPAAHVSAAHVRGSGLPVVLPGPLGRR